MGGGAGGPLAPQYLADQLTLFQSGEGKNNFKEIQFELR